MDGTASVTDLRRRAVTVLFGDARGGVLFVAALVFFGVYWSTGLFSSDTPALANVLVNLSEGHLHLARLEYGPSSGAMPGVKVIDGRLYGRNYGQAFLSLPAYFAIRGLALVFDLRLLVVGAWCLGALFVAMAIGQRFGWREQVAVLGSGVVVLTFVANVALATAIAPATRGLLALQVTAALAAAAIPVVVYRLVADCYDRRIGTVAGAATFLATPVGFWATIPKRHSLTALFALLALFSFHLSRRTDDPARRRRHRAISYAWVGLTAWILSAEGLVLLVALGSVDLVTAPHNGRRELLVVALVLSVSLVPFFATNLAITGNPLLSPRMADPDPGSRGPGGAPITDPPGDGNGGGAGDGGGDGGDGQEPPPGGDSGDGSGDGSGAPPPDGPGLGVQVAQLLGTVLGTFGSVVAAGTDLSKLGTVFVRWGYVASLEVEDAAVNLSVLESMPALAAVAGVPALAVRRARAVDRTGRPDPGAALAALRNSSLERQLDLLAGVYLLGLFALYAPRLPLHHMFTVRYLHPLYPIGVYGLVRFRPVRSVLSNRPRSTVASYLGAFAVVLVGFVVALGAFGAHRSEAVQLYAHLALAVAAVVGAWSLLATLDRAGDRTGSVVLGVASAVVTVYLLVAGVEVFHGGSDALLPMVRYVGESIRIVTT